MKKNKKLKILSIILLYTDLKNLKANKEENN
jgi:hypothetical protein